MELCRGRAIRYKALARHLNSRSGEGVLVIIASCYYRMVGVEILWDGDSLKQVVPPEMVACQTTLYVASRTVPVKFSLPKSITVTDGFGSHEIVVEDWNRRDDANSRPGATEASEKPLETIISGALLDMAELLEGNSHATVRFATSDGLQVDEDFNLGVAAVSASWMLEPGSAGGLTGYWIFACDDISCGNSSDDAICWQAENADGPLSFWNLDGRATGNPGDSELFVFELVETNQVRIKNVNGAYVNKVGNKLSCTGDQAGAATLLITFVNNT